MSQLWTILSHAHSAAGPITMLVWPLYASVMAMESPSKDDDEQWLAYWILYSFLTLVEMLAQPLLEWVPIWYDLKLALVAWLVLPQFRGAAFLYERYVREEIINRFGFSGRQNHTHHHRSKIDDAGKGKKNYKFLDIITFTPYKKKGEQEAY